MKRDLPQSSDAEIVRQVLQGNVNSFETLLARYEGPVARIVSKHVPSGEMEETVQEVFVRAYQSLPTFRKGGLFRQWVCSIAVRTCHDYWRRAYRSREVSISTLTERHQDWLERVLAEESDQEGALQEEVSQLLEAAMGRLSAEERMVLEMVYLEGLSGRETADLLGWSVAKVKVRSFRARRKLEKYLRTVMKRREPS